MPANQNPADLGKSWAMNRHLYPYSMATFRELIMDILVTTRAKNLVEVGSEHGVFTEFLCAHAQKIGGRMISIDTYLQPSAAEFMKTHAGQPYFEFIENTSLQALPGLKADAYIIDGDHNYYTVRRELELIAEACGDAPWVAILHDVCWPCARRDMYYNPATIPAPSLRPHSCLHGITPGNSGTVKGGMCYGGGLAFALEEGGPSNGVKTAVEDFLAARRDFEFNIIPLVLGLGVIYSRSQPWSEALSKLLSPWDRNPLLQRVETNRLDLLMRVLELQDQLLQQPAAPRPPEVKRPKSPHGLRHLAQAFFMEQDWEEAGLLYQTLASIFPNEIEIWRARLECARRRNHRTHARLILQDAVRLHPEWREILAPEQVLAAQAA